MSPSGLVYYCRMLYIVSACRIVVNDEMIWIWKEPYRPRKAVSSLRNFVLLLRLSTQMLLQYACFTCSVKPVVCDSVTPLLFPGLLNFKRDFITSYYVKRLHLFNLTMFYVRRSEAFKQDTTTYLKFII